LFQREIGILSILEIDEPRDNFFIFTVKKLESYWTIPSWDIVDLQLKKWNKRYFKNKTGDNAGKYGN